MKRELLERITIEFPAEELPQFHEELKHRNYDVIRSGGLVKSINKKISFNGKKVLLRGCQKYIPGKHEYILEQVIKTTYPKELPKESETDLDKFDKLLHDYIKNEAWLDSVKMDTETITYKQLKAFIKKARRE